ncbi:iron-containing alcohol dehydrogenase [Salisediminibacterium halotolerans]|uniref:iron-containing alcohol dehydrogenase n=1 Tax=Salisediminibacterium halotolerans TaxID=517425 RepID=UPI000EB03B02|nr:iron-containing alcohol dehydrogenase [Salisediminibacterium halotolerans]RLJ73192.1 alcohol dehydrogenase class IV [Actinophytocola xinjiangensis]RPE86614.1 alcohol dehydrogenase class IV [Salisediminibacterium halotolerans]TWG33989.1 alcohol dehydrogenase class IV [Salisediminibacterium halotolerans]GEL06604.1 alcohol dehydrogenase [Salisediminibacterium halotolerans]
MKICWYRTRQIVMRGLAYLVPWHRPALIEGERSIRELPRYIRERRIQRVLIVTDPGVSSLPLFRRFCEDLSEAGLSITIYNKTVPDPTEANAEEACSEFHQNYCEAVVAFGGGSAIDCAKGASALIARPDLSLTEMKGVWKIRRKTPPLFAVPTTQGTGSEATIAAVLTNPSTHEKYAISDHVLMPDAVVLDPLVTAGLPPNISAWTGMDALTHAVEAYIGRSRTNETKKLARQAVQLIFANLEETYRNGENVEARKNMQRAAYFAGLAFTRSYVGYVHAIAHTLGGLYSVPHGKANAIVLPHVLMYYGEAVHKPLADLAEEAGVAALGQTDAAKAAGFIKAVQQLNTQLDIPGKIDDLRKDDISLMAARAAAEANPFYPVPRILTEADLRFLYEKLTAD